MIRHLSNTVGRRVVLADMGTTRALHPIAVVSSMSGTIPSTQRLFATKVKKGGKGEVSGRTRELELMLACIDAPKTKPPPADKEEMARREQVRKAYTIGKFKEHNEENHDLACKLKMKRHAINMLPKDSALKEKALQMDDKDDNYPPRWRHIPAWTPPIKGFDPTAYMSIEE